ncbi:MAG: gliding motility-associated C-terminal domain-containing protein [Bacteroidetes bacterium]|nr:gliding motility-associated C-terminal domain-containing protein [Bacteroidota bacterium]
MKKTSLILAFALVISFIHAQQRVVNFNIPQKKYFSMDSLIGFNEDSVKKICAEEHFFGSEFTYYMRFSKRRFIKNKYKLNPPQQPSQQHFTDFKTIGASTINTTPCNNEDFELGNISGWSISAGTNTNSATMGGCCPALSIGNFSMFTAAQTDPATGISLASPLGGNYVCKINDWCPDYEVTRLNKTFAVTSANALFQIAYFAVLEDGGHSCSSQPYVNVSILNCSGTQLSCPYVQVVGPGSGCTSTVTGWTAGTALTYSSPTTYTYVRAPDAYSGTTSLYPPVYTGTTVLTGSQCYGGFTGSWSGWKVMSLDLTPYIGSCITIQLTCADCTAGGHRGWAYFDCLCSPMNITVNNTSFPAGTSASTISACGAATGTITAPPGLGPYTWNGPAGSGISNNHNQTITTGTSGNYTLSMNPPGYCAPITKTVTLLFSPVPTSGFSTSNACNNYTITNTGSSAPAVQSYSFLGVGAPANFTTTSGSSAVTFPPSGTYTIMQVVTNTANCTASLTSVVTVPAPPNAAFTIPTATQCLTGNAFNFNATVGTGTHTYTFNPTAGAPAAGSTANYSGSFSSTGTYTVTHTITNGGCSATATSVVVVNPIPSITSSFTNASCGTNNGIIIINNTSPGGQTATGFTSNGSAIPSQTLTGLAAGTYVLGITNNFGCTYTISTTVSNTPPVTALATTPTNPTCGNSNGSITLGAVSGGTAPYTYNVNGGAYSGAPPLTSLAAGTYTIGVKDANGCIFTKTVTLTNIPGPTAISFTTSPTACSPNTGVIGVTGVIGGTSAYTFSVNGASSPSVVTSLGVGTYTILVKDANNCTYSTTANVTMVTGITSAVINTINATCGNSNGSATVASVTGGAPAYQYSFNGGAFTSSTSVGSMAAGPKNVVIKDANSCTLTINFVIGNTGSPTVAIASTTNVSCNGGSNGGFGVTVTGGTPGYNYTLNPGNITSGFSSFSGLSAQGYTVLVADAAGCLTSITNTITQPAVLTLTTSSTPPLCNGGNNGTVTAGGSGGTAPYQYNINSGTNQASNAFTTNISAGVYNVTVVDSKGCTASQTISVSQPPAITVAFTTTNANCSSANGNASVSVTGGSPAYAYTWSPSGGNSAITSGVATGNYTVLVKDVNNCTVTGVANVPASISGTAVISNISNVKCFGASNGSLTGNMSAGTAPITYSWSNGSTLQSPTGLPPGTYTLTTTDFYGCKSTTFATITQPAIIDFFLASSPAACFNTATGTATCNIIGGGTAPYSYMWNPSGITSYTASGLSAGLYSCTVIDANNCTITKTVTVTQPTSITIVSSTVATNCGQANGSVSSTVTGGTAPYTYTWSSGANTANLTNVPAGTYTVQVQDANNCLYSLAATVPNLSGPSITVQSQTNVSCFNGNNGQAIVLGSGGTSGPGFPHYSWSNGQNTNAATNLIAGVYTASVTDAAGCVASVSLTITQPSSLVVNVSGTNPKCYNATNGSANAGVTGGTGPYTYTWVPAPGSGVNTSAPASMGPGNYIVNITDANGCPITGSVNLANPAQMLSSVSFSNVTCNGASNGIAIASSSNAIGAVSYYYVGGPSPITTQTAVGLGNATYTMTATDMNNCVATTIFTITQPPLLTVSISAIGTPSCSGATNGFVTSSPGGGTPGYSYLWSNGQTGATANNLGAGTYTITVTDANTCTASAIATVTQPAGLTAAVTVSNVTCYLANNGIGNVSYSGGTGIPTILWQPGLQTTATPNNLSVPAGIYVQTQTITVTDGNGCVMTKTINLTQPTALTSSIVNIVPTNCNQSNGSASVSATGGSGGYTYQWSSNPLFTNSSITNVLAGAYTVVVTDANTCTTTAVANINNIAGPSVTGLISTSVTCYGLSNGGATVTASGGVGTLTYQWSYLGQTTPGVNNLPQGLHSVTIKDAANCITSTVVNIPQPTQVVSAITGFTNVTCSGANNGIAVVQANGGMGTYSYTWTPSGNNTATLTNAAPAIYTVNIVDANNCPTSSTVNLSQPNPLLITTNTVVNELCNGGTNASINTSISGGTPAYTIAWSPTEPANPIITNLAQGSYTITITDANNCTITANYNITQPTALSITGSGTTQATCGNSNGTAFVTIGGGTAPYNYNWNTPSTQTTNTATALSPGTWICNMTDADGCPISYTANVPAAPLPTVSLVESNVTCNGYGNGSATITSAGVGPFTYSWTPSSVTGSLATNLTPGNYIVNIIDANGCTSFTSFAVTQPQALTVPPVPVSACFGQNTAVTAQAGGGTAPYSYTLTNMATGASTSSNSITQGVVVYTSFTASTNYSVSVSDANGCSASANIPVNISPSLQAVGGSYTLCQGNNVTLSPTISSTYMGNGGPYNYSWQGGGSAASINVIGNPATSPAIYTVAINDYQNCTVPGATAIFTVITHENPALTYTSTPKTGCFPLTVTYIAQSDSAATFVYDIDPLTMSYNQNSNPLTISFPHPGRYSMNIVATNKWGCTSALTESLAAQVWPIPEAQFMAVPQSVSLLNPTISFTNQSTGASTYYWDFGDYSNPNTNTSNSINPSHIYQDAGSYYVNLVAINQYGCKDTATNVVQVTPDMGLYIPNAFTPDDNNINDVFLPKGYGIDQNRYTMEIYDRWGELIFTSNNFVKGWDGTTKGQPVKDDVYVYKISVYDLQGKKHDYVGHVTLLR